MLSLPQVVSDCGDLGFYGNHLMAMQGPFSVEMNVAMLHAVGSGLDGHQGVWDRRRL